MIGAIDIGGTKIAIGIVTDAGTLLRHSEIATNPAAGFADAMHRISSVLRKLADEEGASLIGIGVACPGPLDPFTAAHMAGWQSDGIPWLGIRRSDCSGE
jgi:glucokinase